MDSHRCKPRSPVDGGVKFRPRSQALHVAIPARRPRPNLRRLTTDTLALGALVAAAPAGAAGTDKSGGRNSVWFAAGINDEDNGLLGTLRAEK